MQNTTHPTSNQTQSSQRPPTRGISNDMQQEDFSELVADISTAVTRYCSRRPQVAAGFLFSLGFVVGWKLRPW